MTTRPSLARLLRRLADRLEPRPPEVATVTQADVELIDGLRREAAEFGMADECSRIKREIDEANANGVINSVPPWPEQVRQYEKWLEQKDEIDRGLDTVYRPHLTVVGKKG